MSSHNSSTRTEKSKLEQLRELPPEKQRAFLDSITDAEALAIPYDIEFIGRPSQQIPPPDVHHTVLALAGRGWGKTFVGAHTVQNWAKNYPGCRIALIGETARDVRDVMVKGESGILRWSHPHNIPHYNPSNSVLTWENGSIAQTFSNEAYEQLRGQQFQFGWIDELAKFRYQQEAWDMYLLALRLGDVQQTLITTTPRPTTLIKQMANDPDVKVITGSTFENTSLPKSFLERIRKKYEGTRLGQQELYAHILEDNPGALFHYNNIDDNRVNNISKENMDRIVVCVDPAGTANANSDDTGIIVVGRMGDHAYILEDATLKGSPNEWAQKAISLYRQWEANDIIVETNFGGDMVENTIRGLDRNIRVKQVRASRGKALRAEPVAALYEQNRVHHAGILTELEEEMTSFNPELGRNQKSPNRLDAMVYGVTDLLVAETVEVDIWVV